MNEKLSILLILIALATVIIGPHDYEWIFEYRILYWGIPGAVLVFAFASLEKNLGPKQFPLIYLIGEASYSIYLFHPFIIRPIGLLAEKLGVTGHYYSSILIVMMGVIGSVVLGILIFLYVEKPTLRILKFWYSKFASSRAA